MDITVALGLKPADSKDVLLLLRENFANPLSWILFLRPDVPLVTHRIRKYVLNGDATEAWRLKESFKDTLALEAVSAAIIAQIAITMPGLSDFGNIHWTATAFAYTSLVSGLLSTYFAFYVQRTLSDIHSPEDVREWLTSPRNNFTNHFINVILRRNRARRTSEHAPNNGERIPSLTAAAFLTAPSRLLSFSIFALFVTLGIYLVSLYTARLGTLKGSNANLGVLIFFIIALLAALAEVVNPLQFRRIDQITASSVRNEEERGFQLQELGNSQHNIGSTTAVAPSETSETGDVIREALKASICAQEESLKAQKALLEFYYPVRISQSSVPQ